MAEETPVHSPRIRLFGSVRVLQEDGSAVRLGGARQRAVLTMLALSASRMVAVDGLVDAIWGERPPPSVTNALQVHVSTLRTALAPLGLEIRRVGSGYRLDCHVAEVDTGKVAALHSEGRARLASGDPHAALHLLERAQELASEPLASGVHLTPSLIDALAVVEDEVRAARMTLVEALCTVDRAERAVPLARELTKQLPFDEATWMALMTAQYRAGRSGDALETYQRARRLLVEELGVDPSPQLAGLQTAILNHELPPTGAYQGASPPGPAGRFERFAAAAHSLFNEAAGRAAAVDALEVAAEVEFRTTVEGLEAGEQARLRQMVSAVEELRVEQLASTGQLREARELMTHLVAAKPNREQRVRQQMRLLYRCGLRADALAAYRACRDRLHEAGRRPSDETRQLEAGIVRDDPRLRDDLRPVLGPRTWFSRGIGPPPPGPLLVLATDQLSALSPATRTLVEAVSVLGPSDSELLAHVTGLGQTVLTSALTEATAAGLLASAVDPDCPESTYQIPNAALASSIENLVPQQGAVELKSRAAQALLGRGDVRSAVHGCVMLVSDRALTLRLGDQLQRTLARCVDAGDLAVADELTSRALEVVAEPNALRVDLFTTRVRVLSALGRAHEAQQVWQHAIEAARTVGDPERFGLAVLSRDWAWRSVSAPASDSAVFAEALELLDREPTALRIRLIGGQLTENLGRDGVPPDPAAIEDVLEHATALGDADSICVALHLRHVAERGSPALGGRREIGAELSLWSQTAQDPMWEARAMVAEVYDLFVAGDLHAVPRLAGRLDALATDLRSSRLRWHHGLIQASLCREQARWSEARTWADQAAVEGAGAGIIDAPAAAVLHQFLTTFHLATTAALLPPIQRFLELRPDNTLARACHSLALFDNGATEASRRELVETMHRVEHQVTDEARPLVLGLLGEVAIRLGDEKSGRLLSSALLPYAGQFIVFGQVSGTFGPVDRVLASLSDVLGEVAAADHYRGTALRAACEAGATAWAGSTT